MNAVRIELLSERLSTCGESSQSILSLTGARTAQAAPVQPATITPASAANSVAVGGSHIDSTKSNISRVTSKGSR